MKLRGSLTATRNHRNSLRSVDSTPVISFLILRVPAHVVLTNIPKMMICSIKKDLIWPSKETIKSCYRADTHPFVLGTEQE